MYDAHVSQCKHHLSCANQHATTSTVVNRHCSLYDNCYPCSLCIRTSPSQVTKWNSTELHGMFGSEPYLKRVVQFLRVPPLKPGPPKLPIFRAVLRRRRELRANIFRKKRDVDKCEKCKLRRTQYGTSKFDKI